MSKKIILALIFLLLTVSLVSANLLEEAKKSQERRRAEITGNAITQQPTIIAKPTIITKTKPQLTTTEKIISGQAEFGVIKPGDKIIIGNSELVATRLLKYEIKDKGELTEIDLGFMILSVPTESFRKEFKISTGEEKVALADRTEKVGNNPVVGAPVADLDTHERKTIADSVTGAAILTTKSSTTLKDKFFSTDDTSNNPVIGAPVADLKKENKDKRFKVNNPKKSKTIFKNMRGNNPVIGAPVASVKKPTPKIITKLKELFSPN